MIYAVIAGTGFDSFIRWSEKIMIDTPYGDALIYQVHSKELTYYYVPRHGIDHSVAPHLINYRAYLWALKSLNVEFIFSLCAVGSCKESIAPGGFVLINDVLDRTQGRINTFFDGINNPLKHLEVSKLYNSTMIQILKKSFESYSQYSIFEGIYVCTQGPRFETAIEIKEYNQLGCSVVGMTNVPEVFLAAELEIHYCSLGFVTNYCTGIIEKPVELSANFKSVSRDVINLLESIMDSLIPIEILGEPPRFI